MLTQARTGQHRRIGLPCSSIPSSIDNTICACGHPVTQACSEVSLSPWQRLLHHKLLKKGACLSLQLLSDAWGLRPQRPPHPAPCFHPGLVCCSINSPAHIHASKVMTGWSFLWNFPKDNYSIFIHLDFIAFTHFNIIWLTFFFLWLDRGGKGQICVFKHFPRTWEKNPYTVESVNKETHLKLHT